MPLKKSKGNMYDWCTHTKSYLGGECPHKCSYCYCKKYPINLSERYKGELRLIYPELEENLGTGKTIFIEHMNDLFADRVDKEWIGRIMTHCKLYPNNKYVFQTKNPLNAFDWFFKLVFPKDFIMGTTIETDRLTQGCAPLTSGRSKGIRTFREYGCSTFITIEPIMDFDVDVLSEWIINDKPDFVNIGADSKGCHLPEPSAEKVGGLISNLEQAGIKVKLKSNLARILKPKEE